MAEGNGSLFLFDSEIEDLISDFLKSTNPWWMIGSGKREEVASLLPELFSDVNQLTDLGDALFWRQINEIRRKYKADPERRVMFLRAIVYLYNYVIKTYPDLNLFTESRTLYPSLLDNRSFVTEWLEGGFVFMTFHPGLTYNSKDRYIFILRGAELDSSKFRSNSYVKLDLSSIASAYYRKCVFEYACSGIDKVKNFNSTVYSFPLNLLSELKRSPGYKWTQENALLASESAFLMEHLRKKHEGKETSVQSLSSMLKGFFIWCVNKEYLTVDNKFFDNFYIHRKKAVTQTIKRPEADVLDTILKASKKKAEDDPEHFLVMDAVVRLLLSTKLRVSSICGLKRDCVRPTLKPGSYRLAFVSKTSYGDEQTAPLIPANKALIDKVLAFTEPLTSAAPPEYRDMLLLYVPNRKKYIRTPDKFSFWRYMDSLCNECGLPRTVASSLRKEYQSQVKTFVIEEEKDDVEYKSLSGHVNLDTTEKHYVSMRIEDYFIQMYQVELGIHREEIKQKVVPKIPDNLERVGDTHNKCGACNSSECLAKLALPCFICKDFITSKEFLPVFKRMVDEIDEKLATAANPHDKEDLTAVKSVLVNYIIELTRLA